MAKMCAKLRLEIIDYVSIMHMCMKIIFREEFYVKKKMIQNYCDFMAKR